jgi:hypothetical protein
MSITNLLNPVPVPRLKGEEVREGERRRHSSPYPVMYTSAHDAGVGDEDTSTPLSLSMSKPAAESESSQPSQVGKSSPEDIMAEQIRALAQEFERLGLDCYAGEVVKSEGGMVWKPRFEGDQ